MDGKTLSRDLAQTLLEDPDLSAKLKPRVTYRLLWEAAIEMGRRLRRPTAEATVTTVADQRRGYLLPADFSALYLRDSRDEFFCRYYNGSAYTTLRMLEESDVFEGNVTTSQETPGGFIITDYRTAQDNITGTATSAGAKGADGKSTLSDTGQTFLSTVNVGDTIHNIGDGSTGYVLAVTDNENLVTALFDGTNNDWSISGTADTYVIVPQPRYELAFDAPAKTAGYVLTIPYVQRPAPVFSSYGRYLFPADLSSALVKYAAWLYKYRDSEPNFGDRWWKLYDRDLRLAAGSKASAQTTKRVKVYMKVRG